MNGSKVNGSGRDVKGEGGGGGDECGGMEEGWKHWSWSGGGVVEPFLASQMKEINAHFSSM